jgi:hypothetical protein
MFDPEKFSRWIERKGRAYVAWHDRRAKARRKKTLNDHHTLEICIALCTILLVLGLINHQSAIYLRLVCELAAIVVLLKFVQFIAIALHRNEGSDE